MSVDDGVLAAGGWIGGRDGWNARGDRRSCSSAIRRTWDALAIVVRSVRVLITASFFLNDRNHVNPRFQPSLNSATSGWPWTCGRTSRVCTSKRPTRGRPAVASSSPMPWGVRPAWVEPLTDSRRLCPLHLGVIR